MIIDADIETSKMFKILLEKEGFEIELVHSKSQLYKKINDFKPEIVILSDIIPDNVKMIQQKYIKNINIPKNILITYNRYLKKEKEILFNKYNIVDFVNPNDIVNELITIIQKYL